MRDRLRRPVFAFVVIVVSAVCVPAAASAQDGFTPAPASAGPLRQLGVVDLRQIASQTQALADVPSPFEVSAVSPPDGEPHGRSGDGEPARSHACRDLILARHQQADAHRGHGQRQPLGRRVDLAAAALE